MASKTTVQIHRWTDDDDARLEAAVLALDRIETKVQRVYDGQEAIEARLVAIEAGLRRLLGMWV